MYAGVPSSAPEAEVHHDRLRSSVVAALDEHVARLEVAMDDAEPVRLVDRNRDVAHDRELLIEGHLRCR
jgi:hypothetical protein